MYLDKRKLVTKISKDTGISQYATQLIIDSLISEIRERVSRGDEVRLKWFGTFRVCFTKPRSGYNFKTGQRVPIPPRPFIKFIPATLFHSRMVKNYPPDAPRKLK